MKATSTDVKTKGCTRNGCVNCVSKRVRAPVTQAHHHFCVKFELNLSVGSDRMTVFVRKCTRSFEMYHHIGWSLIVLVICGSVQSEWCCILIGTDSPTATLRPFHQPHHKQHTHEYSHTHTHMRANSQILCLAINSEGRR